MARQSAASLKLDPNVRCERVYPVESTTKTVSDLKTIGLKLSSSQARHLALVLLAAADVWEEIDITAYRFEKRISDGTYHITVTSFLPNEVGEAEAV